MDEETRLKARELLLRSRIYRFLGLVFGGLGLVVFVFLYFRNIQGDFLNAFRDVSTLLMVVVPFLPAFVLSGMAVKAEHRLNKILQKEGKE